MKEKICARISENHEYICENKGIARSGENICTQLELTLDDCLCDYWAYIDFTKPDGTTYKTSKLDIIGNKVIYDLPNVLLSKNGTLKVQVVLQKEDGEVWKSTIKHYTISTSINATDDIPNQDDFITEAQKLLNEVEEGLTPTIGENDNWFICGKDTGKTSRGEKGDKGDKGDAGSIKFIIANELPTEDIEEDAIYMIPSNDPQAENTYQEYIYVNGAWESLGGASVNVDMADYPTKNEMKAITGELENLGTEDKSNLVNAINEAMNNSGLYVFTTSLSIDGYKELNATTGSDFAEIVNTAYKKGDKSFTFILNSSASNHVYILSSYCDMSKQNTYMPFKVVNETLNSQNTLLIRGSWTDNVFKVSNVTYDFRASSKPYLTKDNTTSYTPTSTYHPATKGYVDSTIASAITTTLEGSY